MTKSARQTTLEPKRKNTDEMDNLADNTYLMKTHLRTEKVQRGDARRSSRVELRVSPCSRPRLSRRRPSPPHAAAPAPRQYAEGETEGKW
jgi:hypothetical protein